ncbi:MAG: hypothetical protein IPL55_05980 [Saprospiraceae bacterium]|nr:hypothetical protein [Saprospiraceae bacterium]
MNYSRTLLNIILLSLFFACSKEGASTFVIPATYRYNSPNLENKYVYVIDPITKNGRIITDSLGTFNRSNSEISDSLNEIITNEFINKSLRSITFNSDNTAKLEFGRLDTTGMKNTIIPTSTSITKYSLSGNKINFDEYPEYFINLNNSFLELNFCQEFTLRNQKLPSGLNFTKYFKTNCTNAEPNAVLNNILSLNPTVIYDTISIEYVNYIFSKY